MCCAAPAARAATLTGADTLYNTYWVRFAHGRTTFAQAVANTRILVHAAVQAGVRRIVHVSIANPDPRSPLPYYRGKGELEQFIAASGLSYVFLRPTVVFGGADILINNIAWLVRHVPVFLVPGDGRYRVQPIHVEDLADLAVAAGAHSDNLILDAVGPETFTFDELVHTIAAALGRRVRCLHVPPWLALAAARVIGRFVGDVTLTRDELRGLMGDLLVSAAPPTGTTRLTTWLHTHAADVGRHYASELQRHYDRA